MPRDMDLVRELLLRLDAVPVGPLYTITAPQDEEVNVPGFDPATINDHLEMMAEAGFLEAPGSWPAAGGITFRRLTWEGHDFLDSVRDPEVWKETKSGLSKVGGWTVDLMKDAAKAYLKMKAKDVLGLDL